MGSASCIIFSRIELYSTEGMSGRGPGNILFDTVSGRGGVRFVFVRRNKRCNDRRTRLQATRTWYSIAFNTASSAAVIVVATVP